VSVSFTPARLFGNRGLCLPACLSTYVRML
jgi:hypothetical protein